MNYTKKGEFVLEETDIPDRFCFASGKELIMIDKSGMAYNVHSLKPKAFLKISTWARNEIIKLSTDSMPTKAPNDFGQRASVFA